MKILIRCDASVHIGTGHVMRCLTIAKEFKEKGHTIDFWMMPLPGDLIAYVKNEGFNVVHEQKQCDLLIIDHYGLDEEFETSMRVYAKQIVVIDDLANRNHNCDLLLDQNYLVHYETRYDRLVPQHCKKLLGPSYLILRDEFLQMKKVIKQRSGHVQNLVVFMGGSDPTNETTKVLSALRQSEIRFLNVDIVVGNSNPLKETIKIECEEQGFGFHCQINYLAKLMNEADFLIGAGGLTMWERCFLGLPSSSTIVANNQLATTKYCEQKGIILNMGWHEEASIDRYSHLLHTIKSHPERLKIISEECLKTTKGITENKPWFVEMEALIHDKNWS